MKLLKMKDQRLNSGNAQVYERFGVYRCASKIGVPTHYSSGQRLLIEIQKHEKYPFLLETINQWFIENATFNMKCNRIIISNLFIEYLCKLS